MSLSLPGYVSEPIRQCLLLRLIMGQMEGIYMQM